MSNLLVQNIKHTNNTTAMTIDSSGNVTESNYEIDMYRLTTDVTSNTTAITNWERVDDASFSKIGTGITESSGTWTFPRTGLYRVDLFGNIFSTNVDQATILRINVTTDNSSYDTASQGQEGVQSTPDTNQNLAIFALINVTDTSNVKFQIQSTSMETNGAIVGDTNNSKTAILIERKGNAQ